MAALPIADANRPGRSSNPAPMIRALLGANGQDLGDLIPVLRMSKGQISKRMNGIIPWRAHELDAVAGFFDLTIGQLFRDPRALLKSGGESRQALSEKSERASDQRKRAVVEPPIVLRKSRERRAETYVPRSTSRPVKAVG